MCGIDGGSESVGVEDGGRRRGGGKERRSGIAETAGCAEEVSGVVPRFCFTRCHVLPLRLTNVHQSLNPELRWPGGADFYDLGASHLAEKGREPYWSRLSAEGLACYENIYAHVAGGTAGDGVENKHLRSMCGISPYSEPCQEIVLQSLSCLRSR